MEEATKINKQKLRNMALKGASAQELLNALDISDSMVLSTALLELLRGEEESEPEEVGRVEHYEMNPRYDERGILIRPDMLKGSQFKKGDEFGLTVEEDRIVLDRESVGSVGPL